ncbi:hypothetical protein [Acinetobacter sp. Ac_5812]|uniref:hypothetical protein n=1 Tax=Acinetobacter sp. Ac_5812 TaxID=1848937 RepID=UPI001C0839E9|nr:hypothetical protein [Acinetobacter sp. Ac_5812]
MKLKEINTLVDAGEVNLNRYTFVSEELNKEENTQLMADEPTGDKEEKVYFRLNQTGNIFYAMTANVDGINDRTKKLFESVTVLFAAMTAALGAAEKTLFDYEAWTALIRKSGFFVEVQKSYHTLHIKEKSVTIDTQIIQQLLPGVATGNALLIAKSVLSALNGEFSSRTEDDKTKIAHLLFFCEELFGAPSVTVRVFYASKNTHHELVKTSCATVSNTSIDLTQEANTFMFVSPDSIAEFAQKFKDVPEAYLELIEKFKKDISS